METRGVEVKCLEELLVRETNVFPYSLVHFVGGLFSYVQEKHNKD